MEERLQMNRMSSVRGKDLLKETMTKAALFNGRLLYAEVMIRMSELTGEYYEAGAKRVDTLRMVTHTGYLT